MATKVVDSENQHYMPCDRAGDFESCTCSLQKYELDLLVERVQRIEHNTHECTKIAAIIVGTIAVVSAVGLTALTTLYMSASIITKFIA